MKNTSSMKRCQTFVLPHTALGGHNKTQIHQALVMHKYFQLHPMLPCFCCERFFCMVQILRLAGGPDGGVVESLDLGLDGRARLLGTGLWMGSLLAPAGLSVLWFFKMLTSNTTRCITTQLQKPASATLLPKVDPILWTMIQKKNAKLLLLVI